MYSGTMGSGERQFRELEPHRRLVAADRGAESGGHADADYRIGTGAQGGSGSNMTTSMRITRRQMLLPLSMIACATCLTTFAQAPPVPGGCNVPASQRAGDIGCYLSATETLGALPEDARFWHIYNYPTLPAVEAVKGPRGTVVEAFGKVWLYAIAASTWKPAGGQRIAVVGPLPIAVRPA